jgi:hypothetical protein
MRTLYNFKSGQATSVTGFPVLCSGQLANIRDATKQGNAVLRPTKEMPLPGRSCVLDYRGEAYQIMRRLVPDD